MPRQVLFNTEARNNIKKGIDIVADAVKVTLGPKGRNVMITQPFGSPHMTKDGVTVAREISLKDEFENMGAQFVKEAASTTGDVAGDGTTTATVLAQYIIKEGLKLIDKGINPMELKDGIDIATDAIISELKSMSKSCDSSEMLQKIAEVSSNNQNIRFLDKETDKVTIRSIGSLIEEAITKVGEYGIVNVEESKNTISSLEYTEGLKIESGYLSPIFITNRIKRTSELEKPFILLCQGKITGIKDILEVLEKVAAERRSLLLIAEDISGEALNTLIVNHANNVVTAAVIKAPSFGDNQKEIMQDIALLTGAKIIGTEQNITLENAVNCLGSIDSVQISQESTILINETKKDKTTKILQERVEEIKEHIKIAKEHNVPALKKRLSCLTGGVALIKIGAPTLMEVKEKRDLVDDALFATRAAAEEGIVPGGGIALLKAFITLSKKEFKKEYIAGVNLLFDACAIPFFQILVNAGYPNPENLVETLPSRLKEDPYFGYDARENKIVNLLQKGIMDPTKVTCTALQNAASIAGLFLTTEAAIAEEPREVQNGISLPR